MYIISHAWRNVFRNRGRNILLGSITLVVIAATVVSLIISNTSSSIIEDYRARFGSQVTLQPDMNEVIARAEVEAQSSSRGQPIRLSVPQIPAEQYLAFAESEYLQQTVFSAVVGVNNQDIAAIDAEADEDDADSTDDIESDALQEATDPRGAADNQMINPGGMIAGQTMLGRYDFRLVSSSFSEFSEGTRALRDGVMPDNPGECIISSDLAEENSLVVGDVLTLSTELTKSDSSLLDETDQETLEISYSLTIVGIFYDATEQYSESMMEMAFSNSRNEILTNFDTILAQYRSGWSGISISAVYYLKDPNYVEDFATELYEKGLDPLFYVTTDTTSYNQIVQPVINLKNIASVFVVVVLIIGAAIITLLASLAVRERKYEIGVLRAMGMKKTAVGIGLWLELLIITAICLALGLGIGTIVAKPVSNSMLESQQAATANASMPMGMPINPGETSSGGNTIGGRSFSTSGPISIMNAPGMRSEVETISSLDATLSLMTLLQIILLAIALSTIAGIVATVQITKYEPIKILMERN